MEKIQTTPWNDIKTHCDRTFVSYYPEVQLDLLDAVGYAGLGFWFVLCMLADQDTGAFSLSSTKLAQKLKMSRTTLTLKLDELVDCAYLVKHGKKGARQNKPNTYQITIPHNIFQEISTLDKESLL